MMIINGSGVNDQDLYLIRSIAINFLQESMGR